MAHWYYGKGDQQIGPVGDAEIKQLIADGTIGPHDDVWREGMEDWKPAGEMPELFDERPLAQPPPVHRSRNPSASSAWTARASRLLQMDYFARLKPAGQLLLLAGFLLVLWAKGCDSVGQRAAERAQARARIAVDEFDHEYDIRQQRLITEREEINDQPTLEDRDRERLERIDELIAELTKERDDERRRLSRTRWRELQFAADNAQAQQRMWGYWHELAFVFGTMVLTVGLLTVGLTGRGAQRWLCFGMLAIITFSVFVGGFAWVRTMAG